MVILGFIAAVIIFRMKDQIKTYDDDIEDEGKISEVLFFFRQIHNTYVSCICVSYNLFQHMCLIT